MGVREYGSHCEAVRARALYSGCKQFDEEVVVVVEASRRRLDKVTGMVLDHTRGIGREQETRLANVTGTERVKRPASAIDSALVAPAKRLVSVIDNVLAVPAKQLSGVSDTVQEALGTANENTPGSLWEEQAMLHGSTLAALMLA
jgi:hypothetical protein